MGRKGHLISMSLLCCSAYQQARFGPPRRDAGCPAGVRSAQSTAPVQVTSLGSRSVEPCRQAWHTLAPEACRVSRPAGHGVHVFCEMMEGRKVRRGLQGGRGRSWWSWTAVTKEWRWQQDRWLGGQERLVQQVGPCPQASRLNLVSAAPLTSTVSHQGEKGRKMISPRDALRGPACVGVAVGEGAREGVGGGGNRASRAD